MASTKGRFLACSASVGAFLGAAAALVPASCGGTIQDGTGAGSTGGTGGAGNSGTGNSSTGGTGGTIGTGGTGGTIGTGGTGGMVADGGQTIHDAASDLDGTLIDLDGQADVHHIPPDGSDVDGS